MEVSGWARGGADVVNRPPRAPEPSVFCLLFFLSGVGITFFYSWGLWVLLLHLSLPRVFSWVFLDGVQNARTVQLLIEIMWCAQEGDPLPQTQLTLYGAPGSWA